MQMASFIMYAIAFVLVLALSIDASCSGSRSQVTMGLGYSSAILLLVGVILQGVSQYGESGSDYERNRVVVYA